MPVSFDINEIDVQLRQAAEKNAADALANAQDDRSRRFVQAQIALTDATIIQLKVFSELMGADMRFDDVVQVMAAQTSSIVRSMMSATDDADQKTATLNYFLHVLARTVLSGGDHCAEVVATGTPGGRA